MRTIVITEGFTGYPSGKKREFTKGDEPEVPDDFADLVVAKGHAKEKPAEPPAPRAKKESKS